ncbi:MAG: hypothetical protein ACREDT_12775 [Methylocella sp.]
MDALVFGGARVAARKLLARLGHVWIWPGIPLTEKRGAACVPIATDDARFWITRLHGPEAIDTYVLHYLAAAARKLSEGDEAGAQLALDASGLTRLSADGLELMRRVAVSLGIAPLDLPWAEGPRLLRAQDIAAHLPLFKDYAPAAGLLAKLRAFDESKHPRWPAGSPESQGGRFNYGEGGPVAEGRSASSNDGSEGEPPPEIPKERPRTRLGRHVVVRGAADWLARATLARAFAMIRAFQAILEATPWISGEIANIWSSLDEPKSLEELQKAVDEPKAGYQIHHIVEQTPARNELPDELIDGPDNLVRIPTLKHRDIFGWYSKPNKEFGWLSPRDYLRGKDWDTRRKVGIEALIKFGILKP